jgi:hypothetical protein
VVVVVLRLVVVIDEVPALGVVDVAVVVVVDPVVRNVVGVAGDLAREVGHAGVDAGVDDGDQHAGAGAGVPRQRHAHVLARDAVELTGVLQRPLLREERVVGERAELAVELGVSDVGVGVQRGQRGPGALRRADDLGVGQGERVDELHAGVLAQVGSLGLAQPRGALDDDLLRLRSRRQRCEGENDQGEEPHTIPLGIPRDDLRAVVRQPTIRPG